MPVERTSVKKSPVGTPSVQGTAPVAGSNPMSQVSHNTSPSAEPGNAVRNTASDSQQNSEGTEYKPSEDTLKRLNRLPKDDIRKMLGFDIGYLIAHTKTYGVLEALAYGSWTPPIRVVPSWKYPSGFISCRIWQSESEGKFKWGVEDVIPVATRMLQDSNGNPVLNESGKQKMVFDRNELVVTPTTYTGVLYEGKPLSRDQVLRLKLTGHLGEPMTRIDPKTKKTVTEIVDCHPYNNQRIVKVGSNVVRARLMRDPTFRTKSDVFKLTDRQISELSLGRGIWVRSQKEDNCAYVQYDVSSGKLRFANEFEKTLRKFNSERQREKEKAEMSQGMSNGQGQQAAPSHGARP